MGPAAQLLAVAERSDDARVDLQTVAGREQRHVLGKDLGLVLRNEGGTPQVVGLCLRLRVRLQQRLCELLPVPLDDREHAGRVLSLPLIVAAHGCRSFTRTVAATLLHATK